VKGTPEKALAEVGGWVEKMVAQKRGEWRVVTSKVTQIN
jgi:hypothetical protein